MKANFERLIDGAHEAANISFNAINKTPPDLAILANPDTIFEGFFISPIHLQ